MPSSVIIRGTPNPMEPDLAVSKIASELGVDRSSVYRYIRRGNLWAYRLGDGKQRGPFRVKRAELERFKCDRSVLPPNDRKASVAATHNPGHRAALLRLKELGAMTRTTP
jgi:excisionase family DNA binding protein